MKDRFNFFFPLEIEKGGEQGQLRKIKGICSTDAEDSDGETLIPEGYDFEPLLKTGFLNWNHQAKTSSRAICGEPTAAKIINNGKDFYIEGVIYPNEEGRNVIQLAETLEKYSPNRRLGFSIEGQALERDVLNPKKVLRARITGVAITQSPKNPNTLMNIVKGEYSEEFIEEEDETYNEEKKSDVNKAMMVNVDINPPSVEGTKDKNELTEVLKKSDIYNQIYNRYTRDFEKAEQIYNFINTVKTKCMVDNITSDVLEKAFAILDESIEKSEDQKSLKDYDQKEEITGEEDDDDDNTNIDKSEDSDEDDEDSDYNDNDDDEDFEKAMNAEMFAKSLYGEGKSTDEVIKALTSVGFSLTLAETTCSNCIAQANAEKQGGSITVLKKGEENDFGNDLKHYLDEKFTATSTILKSMIERNEALEKKVIDLEKANDQILNTPQPRKSATNASFVERFEKSEDGSGVQVYNAQNPNDMRMLSNRLFQEVEVLKNSGQENKILEKAVADLEIAKSTDFGALAPYLRRLNIAVQG